MIALIVSACYVVGMLLTARHLFQTAVNGGFEADTTSRTLMGAGFALLYSSVWPLLLTGFVLLRIIAQRPKGDQA